MPGMDSCKKAQAQAVQCTFQCMRSNKQRTTMWQAGKDGRLQAQLLNHTPYTCAYTPAHGLSTTGTCQAHGTKNRRMHVGVAQPAQNHQDQFNHPVNIAQQAQLLSDSRDHWANCAVGSSMNGEG
jgi:hypothetical protein